MASKSNKKVEQLIEKMTLVDRATSLAVARERDPDEAFELLREDTLDALHERGEEPPPEAAQEVDVDQLPVVPHVRDGAPVQPRHTPCVERGEEPPPEAAQEVDVDQLPVVPHVRDGAPVQPRHTPCVTIEYFDDSQRNAIGWCCRCHNLFRGCSPVSAACKHCYAMAEGGHQILMNPNSPYARLVVKRGGTWHWTGVVEPTGVHAWLKPFETRQRWLVFANSMSDFFHEDLSEEQILLAVSLMWRARAQMWQVLTKRASRMADIMSRLRCVDGELQLAQVELDPADRFVIPNLWLGVTVEDQDHADERLPLLARTLAAVRFVSVEPILGPVDLTHYRGGFEWVIVGGESGPEYRPMNDDWARNIRDVCVRNEVAFFFKQRAGEHPEHLPKDLDGVFWRQFPHVDLLSVPNDLERKAMQAWVKAEYPRVFGAGGEGAARARPPETASDHVPSTEPGEGADA